MNVDFVFGANEYTNKSTNEFKGDEKNLHTNQKLAECVTSEKPLKQ